MKNIKRIISIDLGLTGYISIFDVNDNKLELINCFKIEVEDKDTKILKTSIKNETIVKKQVSFSQNFDLIFPFVTNDINETVIIFELITTRTFNSNISSMSLTDSLCVFRCISEALKVNYFIIPPQNWKKHCKVTKDKNTSKTFFYQICQEEKVFIKTKSKLINKKVLNHNLVESFLIGYYFYDKYIK